MDSVSGDQIPPRFLDYEGSDYRTSFWEHGRREYEDLVERVALRKLLPPSSKRILDIGAGFGRLTDLYKHYDRVYLLDYSRSLLEEARSRLGTGRFTYVIASLYEMPFAENAFDTVVMVRVLHHQSDVPAALRSIETVVGPGGTFVLEYANKRHLKAILRYLLRHGPSPFSREPLEFAPLHFDFHPAYVEAEMDKAGFSIQRRLAVSTFRVGALKRFVPARVLAALDGLLQGPTAGLQLSPSIFLQAKAQKSGSGLACDPIFRCPLCRSIHLHLKENYLECGGCNRRWAAQDSLFDFKTPLD
ncbi:MAG: class I SAM-dependent methyltransferase [Chloroflexi bacterium]|nr:class I SAM-dependent methyltransferase [Chloroflexota bacterium]